MKKWSNNFCFILETCWSFGHRILTYHPFLSWQMYIKQEFAVISLHGERLKKKNCLMCCIPPWSQVFLSFSLPWAVTWSSNAVDELQTHLVALIWLQFWRLVTVVYVIFSVDGSQIKLFLKDWRAVRVMVLSWFRNQEMGSLYFWEKYRIWSVKDVEMDWKLIIKSRAKFHQVLLCPGAS